MYFKRNHFLPYEGFLRRKIFNFLIYISSALFRFIFENYNLIFFTKAQDGVSKTAASFDLIWHHEMIFFRVDVYCLNIWELRHLCRVRGSTGPRRCSLRSRRLEVVGARKNYFQAPGTGKIIKETIVWENFNNSLSAKMEARRRSETEIKKSLHPS